MTMQTKEDTIKAGELFDGQYKLLKMLSVAFMFVCLLHSPADAQTVVWSMKPSDYDEVNLINRNLYKVVVNGKIGLINADGTIVSEPKNDVLGLFYEHNALMMRIDSKGKIVTGCLMDDGKYYEFKNKYYILNGQDFFSDGLLSVENENGNKGYVDYMGNAVIGFDGKYSRIKPFTEGFAAVFVKEKKRYALIDKDGIEQNFVYGGNGVGAATGRCTNVYKGISYVCDEYGEKFYKYDAKAKGKLEKTSRIKNIDTDYLYCYSSVTGRTKNVPFKEYIYMGNIDLDLNAIPQNGLYGYYFVPSQFTEASKFIDGCAIVKIKGKIGILKYIEDTPFSISVSKSSHDFYAGNAVKCSFTLIAPTVWHDKSIIVNVKSKEGTDIALTSINGNYYFVVRPVTTVTKDYDVTVYGEGLKLYEGKLSYTFKKKTKCTKCGKDKDDCPYRGNHPKKIVPKKNIHKNEPHMAI